MICEVNLSLPQKIIYESLRKADLPTTSSKENGLDLDNVKHKVSYVQEKYKILPLFSDQFDHLDEVLSLHTNDYLSCRWNQFLDNVPENCTRIRLYMDYKKELENRVVRRKILNGKFYGVDNKLAPIPQLSDPRYLGNRCSMNQPRPSLNGNGETIQN